MGRRILQIVKPLLVGESNPYGADPAFALYPLPAHASGGRLAKILGMSRGEYLRTFDRVNLLAAVSTDGRWDIRAARAAVDRIAHPVRVLLGAKVAAAHGVPFQPFTTWYQYPLSGEKGTWLILPHPSARCRIWNDPGAAVRARVAVERLLDACMRMCSRRSQNESVCV